MARQPIALPEGFRYDRVVRVEVVRGRAYELAMLRDFEAAVTVLCDAVLAGADRAWFEDLCPMFGVIWPAARALADRVAGEDLRGRSVLELGCGLALPSLVAAAGGARVVATDQHPHTALFLTENLDRNGLAVDFASFDWRGDVPPGVVERGFDRVIASDVLYTREMPALVAAAFDRFVADDGVGVLADPGRPWLQDFADAARGRGFEVEVDVTEETFLLAVRRRA